MPGSAATYVGGQAVRWPATAVHGRSAGHLRRRTGGSLATYVGERAVGLLLLSGSPSDWARMGIRYGKGQSVEWALGRCSGRLLGWSTAKHMDRFPDRISERPQAEPWARLHADSRARPRPGPRPDLRAGPRPAPPTSPALQGLPAGPRTGPRAGSRAGPPGRRPAHKQYTYTYVRTSRPLFRLWASKNTQAVWWRMERW